MTAPFAGRATRNFVQAHVDDCKPDTAGYCPCPLEDAPADIAELVCSDIGDGMHMPVIDLDLAASLVPSGTPGHFHLYIDRAVSWRAYLRILQAMTDAGIVQRGFLNATEARGFGSLRHPDRPKAQSHD
jgi:hypothetical protein